MRPPRVLSHNAHEDSEERNIRKAVSEEVKEEAELRACGGEEQRACCGSHAGVAGVGCE